MPVPFPIVTLSTTRFCPPSSRNPVRLFVAVLLLNTLPPSVQHPFHSFTSKPASLLAATTRFTTAPFPALTPTVHPLTVPFFTVPWKTRMPRRLMLNGGGPGEAGGQLTVCPLRCRVAPAETFKMPSHP